MSARDATGCAESNQSNRLNDVQPVGPVEPYQPALPAPAYPLTRPLSAAEARRLVAHPERIHALIDAVKAALAECQERIEREVSEGVKS